MANPNYQPRSQEQATAARTVTVACNLPNGITLRAFKPVKINQPILGGGMREVTEYQDTGVRFQVRGNATPAMPDKNFRIPDIASGYALTHGVPAELWEEWLKANKDSAYVVNGCIFAVERDAVGQAKREGERLSGLEPINPDGDKRMPRARGGVGAITAGERDAA